MTVRHRSRVRADPSQPNLRQVHLIQGELFDELRADGWQVEAGQMGENVTTHGVDLLGLPRGTILRFGPPAGVGGSDATADAGVAGRGGPRESGGPAGTAAEAVVVAAGRAKLEAHVVGAVAALTAAVARFGAAERAAERLAAEERPAEGRAGAAVERPAEGRPAGERPAEGAAGRAVEPDQRPAVAVTGLRNPCLQIDGLADGLLKQVAYKDADGRFVRKAGVMGVVLRGGPIRPGDPVAVELPPLPHEPLDRV